MLGLSTAASGLAADTVDTILVRSFDAVTYADLREALAEALAEEGIAQPVVSHFADMLDRTAADLGHPRGLYAQAEILTFCSVAVAARLAMEARENIALCPLSIAVYASGNDAQGAAVAYRPPGLDSAGGELARSLLQRVVTRAARLLGVE